jgi:hypothetical protein
LRLIRVDLPEETEVLITNLMDEKRYPAHEFKRLYHRKRPANNRILSYLTIC